MRLIRRLVLLVCFAGNKCVLVREGLTDEVVAVLILQPCWQNFAGKCRLQDAALGVVAGEGSSPGNARYVQSYLHPYALEISNATGHDCNIVDRGKTLSSKTGLHSRHLCNEIVSQCLAGHCDVITDDVTVKYYH